MVNRLSAQDTEQLLLVRSMLDEARQYAGTVTHLRRLTAMVMLDGVVERVTHLVAVTLGLEVRRNDGLDDLIGKVSASLGAAWNRRGTAAVRQLHRARNSAQHEGVASDRGDIANWAGGVTSYVRSLVEAHFGVDIEQVSLPALVNDVGLRQELLAAEQAKEDGDPGTCVERCALVVQSAQRKWSNLHSPPSRMGIDAWRRMRGAPAAGRANDPVKILEDDVAGVHRLIDLTVFAHDTAEARWFLAINQERPEVLDADDAGRALAFATNWVIGFEEAAVTWVPDRLAQHERARRVVRRNIGDASRVGEVVEVLPQSASAVNVVVRIANVPDEAWFDTWAGRVSQELAKAGPSRHQFGWHLHDDGTAQITLGTKADVATAIKTLQGALAESDRELVDTIDTEMARAAANHKLLADFDAALAAGGLLSDWVRSARIDPENFTTVLNLDPVRCHVGWGGGVSTIQRLLASDPDVLRCYASTDEAAVTFTPDLSAAKLKAVLDRIGPIVRQELDQIAVDRVAAAAAADTMRVGIEALIGGRSAS